MTEVCLWVYVRILACMHGCVCRSFVIQCKAQSPPWQLAPVATPTPHPSPPPSSKRNNPQATLPPPGGFAPVIKPLPPAPVKPAALRKRWLAQGLALFSLLALTLAALNFSSRPPLIHTRGGLRLHRRIVEQDVRQRLVDAQRRARQAALQRWKRPEDRRVAFLHKASDPVTLRGLQAALLAKKQVEAAGGWYGFLYSLYPHQLPNATHRPASERQRITLDTLRAALGNGTVAAVGWDQVVEALGADVLGDYRWLLTKKMKQKDWAWSTNDVVDVTWCVLLVLVLLLVVHGPGHDCSSSKLHGSGTIRCFLKLPPALLTCSCHGHATSFLSPPPHPTRHPTPHQRNRHMSHGDSLPDWANHIWSVELDVAWTGDIVDALLSTVNKTDADWVGYATQRSTSKRAWFWHTCHNWLPADKVYKSMRHAARYSRRLLAAIAQEMRARHVQCDEITAPSVCHVHSDWCVVDDSWQPGHPSLGFDPLTGEDLYQWNTLISPDQWDAVLRADTAVQQQLALPAGGGGGGGNFATGGEWDRGGSSSGMSSSGSGGSSSSSSSKEGIEGGGDLGSSSASNSTTTSGSGSMPTAGASNSTAVGSSGSKQGASRNSGSSKATSWGGRLYHKIKW